MFSKEQQSREKERSHTCLNVVFNQVRALLQATDSLNNQQHDFTFTVSGDNPYILRIEDFHEDASEHMYATTNGVWVLFYDVSEKLANFRCGVLIQIDASGESTCIIYDQFPFVSKMTDPAARVRNATGTGLISENELTAGQEANIRQISDLLTEASEQDNSTLRQLPPQFPPSYIPQ